MCGSHHGTGCLPNVPAGRLCPPAFPYPVSPVEKKNPHYGTHPDIQVPEASPATFPEVIRKFLFDTTSPQRPFCLVLPVSDCPRAPVYENWASLRDIRCRGAWWHPHELVGMGGGLGCATGLVGKQLESPWRAQRLWQYFGQWKWRAGAQWSTERLCQSPLPPTALILAARAAKSHRGQLGGITSVRRNWSFKFSQQVEGRNQTSDCRVIYKTQCHRNSLFCPTEPHG